MNPEFEAVAEDAWISCWLAYQRHPELSDRRLPPRLWEPLRRRLQDVYRKATGEEMATLIIEERP